MLAERLRNSEGGVSIAAITMNMAIRTIPSSGLSVFVSQAYAAHAHQSAASTMRPQSPAQVPWDAGQEQRGDLSDRERESEVEKSCSSSMTGSGTFHTRH